MAIEGTAEEFIIRAPILDGKNGYYRHLMKVVDIRYILCCVLVSIYTFSNNIRTQADWRLYKCKKYESWPMLLVQYTVLTQETSTMTLPLLSVKGQR